HGASPDLARKRRIAVRAGWPLKGRIAAGIEPQADAAFRPEPHPAQSIEELLIAATDEEIGLPGRVPEGKALGDVAGVKRPAKDEHVAIPAVGRRRVEERVGGIGERLRHDRRRSQQGCQKRCRAKLEPKPRHCRTRRITLLMAKALPWEAPPCRPTVRQLALRITNSCP